MKKGSRKKDLPKIHSHEFLNNLFRHPYTKIEAVSFGQIPVVEQLPEGVNKFSIAEIQAEFANEKFITIPETTYPEQRGQRPLMSQPPPTKETWQNRNVRGYWNPLLSANRLHKGRAAKIAGRTWHR